MSSAAEMLTCTTPKEAMTVALSGAMAAGALGGQICIVDDGIGIIGREVGKATPADSNQDWTAVAAMTKRKLSALGPKGIPPALAEKSMPVIPLDGSTVESSTSSIPTSPPDEDILSLITRTKHAIFVDDVESSIFHCDSNAAKAGKICRLLAIPLIGFQQKVIATLQLGFEDGKTMDREELAAWVGYGERVSGILERVLEFRDRKALTEIGVLSREIQDSFYKTPNGWGETYLEKVMELLGADYVHMRLNRPDAARLSLELITPRTPLGQLHKEERPITHAIEDTGSPKVANTAADVLELIKELIESPPLHREFSAFQSAAIFPLHHRGKALGNFAIHSSQEYFFTERMMSLATMAAETAAALASYQEDTFFHARRKDDSASLAAQDTALLASLPMQPDKSQEWLQPILESVCRKMRADWGAIFVSESEDRLVLHSARNWYEDMVGVAEYAVGVGWTGGIAKDEERIVTILQPAIVGDNRADYRVTQKYHAAIEKPENRTREGEIAGRIGVRLAAGKVLIGVLTLGYYRKNSAAIDDVDNLSQEFLKAFARRLTLALEVLRELQRREQSTWASDAKKDVINKIIEALDRDTWEQVLNEVQRHFKADAVGLFELRNFELKPQWTSLGGSEVFLEEAGIGLKTGSRVRTEPDGRADSLTRRQIELAADIRSVVQPGGEARFRSYRNPGLASLVFGVAPVDDRDGLARSALALIQRAAAENRLPDLDEIQRETLKDIAKALGLAIGTQYSLLKRLGDATDLGAIALSGAQLQHDLRKRMEPLEVAIKDLQDKMSPEARETEVRSIWRRIENAKEELVGYGSAYRGPPRKEKCCFEDILTDAQELMLQDTTAVPAMVRLTGSAHVTVEVNHWRLAAALRNLLTNAYEALQMDTEPGKVQISTITEPEGKPERLTIKITNTGRRYERDEIEGFFIPGRTKKKRHMGMGINLARQIVELEGGTFRVDPVETGGVETTVILDCQGSCSMHGPKK